MTARDIGALFYAACQAIADGQVAEVELEEQTRHEENGVQVESLLTITVRKEVKRTVINTGTGSRDDDDG